MALPLWYGWVHRHQRNVASGGRVRGVRDVRDVREAPRQVADALRRGLKEGPDRHGQHLGVRGRNFRGLPRLR